MSTFNIGSVQGGNVAAGDGAQISGDGRLVVTGAVGDAALAELRARLDELAAHIERHPGEVPADLPEAVAETRAEADRDEPDPGRLRVLTGRVIRGAEGVAALSAVATAIGQLPF